MSGICFTHVVFTNWLFTVIDRSFITQNIYPMTVMESNHGRDFAKVGLISKDPNNYDYYKYDEGAKSLGRYSTELNPYFICGKGLWQARYKRLHEDILRKRNSPKYLVYFCGGRGYSCGGYGSRISFMTSLFYLALLTDRAFLIHWNYSVSLETFLQPKTIQWNFHMSQLQHLPHRYHFWGKGKPHRANNRVVRPVRNFTQFRDWISTTDVRSYFTHSVEVVSGYWYFANYLFKNQFLTQQSKTVLRSVKNHTVSLGHKYFLLGCAFDFLFQKSNRLKSRLVHARQNLGFSSYVFKVGIHIRMGDGVFGKKRHIRKQRNIKQFFSCAKHMENKLPQLHKVTRVEDHNTTVKWFLATDDYQIKSYALKHFPNKVVTLHLKLEHIAIFRRQKNSPSAEGFESALLDHFLLSECDIFVLSQSTFGLTSLGVGFHSLSSSSPGTVNCTW